MNHPYHPYHNTNNGTTIKKYAMELILIIDSGKREIFKMSPPRVTAREKKTTGTFQLESTADSSCNVPVSTADYHESLTGASDHDVRRS